MSKKYELPAFLHFGGISQGAYLRWLERKAKAHCIRDRLRGNPDATRESYMLAIHAAVLRCKGFDEYTGEALNWELISCYDNRGSKEGRRDYKARFALLPTVDHLEASAISEFRICGWRTNDAKSDLAYEQFVELCRLVIKHHDNAMIGQMIDASLLAGGAGRAIEP